MLYLDRIDVSGPSKTSAAKECDICQYWCFLNYSFKFLMPAIDVISL